MTDAINFFQSFKMFGLFSSPVIDDSSERKLSRELVRDGRKFAAIAEAEAGNADEAETQTLSANNENLRESLGNIAVWHHEIAMKSYRQAAARYIEASKLRPDQENLLREHSENFLRLAQAAETKIEFLRNLKN